MIFYNIRTGRLYKRLSYISLNIKFLVMEQSDSGKCHCHTIFIAGCNYILISYRSAWLSNIFHAALMSSFNIIAEREECIRSQGYISQLIQPCTFCLSCKHFRLLCKNSLPCAVSKNIHIFLANINVNGIVSFRALIPSLNGRFRT